MRLDLPAAAAEAWAMWRADRALLWPLAGIFLFLPSLALILFLPALPVRPPADAGIEATRMFNRAAIGWFAANMPLLMPVLLVTSFGQLAVLALYLGERRSTLAEGLVRAAGLFPRYLLAMVISGAMVFGGLVLFILPGIYLAGRTLLVGAAVAGEPGSPTGAVGRTFALSRRHGFVLAGVWLLAVLAAQLLGQPLVLIEQGLRQAGVANLVVIFALNALAAAVSAAVALGFTLFQIGLYRQLAR